MSAIDKLFLINVEDIKVNSTIASNVDSQLLIPFISIGEKLHIEPILGSLLYNHLVAGYHAGSLNPKEEELVENFIKVASIYSVFSESLPFLHIKITNKGIVLKNSGETSNNIDDANYRILSKQITNYSEYFKNRLMEFLCNNTVDYPLYMKRSDSIKLDGTAVAKNPFFSGIQF